MDLREAIRSKSVTNVEGALRNSAKSELMAKNAANGAGLLMLAVNMDKVPVFEYLASAIKKRVRSRGSRIGCFGRNTAYPRMSAKIERVLPSETAQTGQSSHLLFGTNRIKMNRGLGLLSLKRVGSKLVTYFHAHGRWYADSGELVFRISSALVCCMSSTRFCLIHRLISLPVSPCCRVPLLLLRCIKSFASKLDSETTTKMSLRKKS